MTKDEELERLRQENAALREELAQLKEQLQTLQEQHVKDSHHSSLPPSSDRFVQQKVSGGLRTDMGIHILCRIRSSLSTLRKQGGDLLHALHQTLLGHRLGWQSG